MQDDELRALIREAIARHLGTPAPGRVVADARVGSVSPGFSGNAPFVRAGDPPSWKTHLSHGRFVFLAPSEPDAPCVVEPHVRCHHCGFCQSYGH